MKLLLIALLCISPQLFAIKVKAKNDNNNITYVKALIRNDMTTATYVKEKKLKQFDYITSIQAYSDETLVFNVKTTYYLSKNPVLKFKYKNSGASHLKLVYQDNHKKTFDKSISIETTNYQYKPFTMLNTSKSRTYKVKEKAIKDIYGEIEVIEGSVEISAPKVASNGGAVPVNIRSSIKAKSVTLFAKEEGYNLTFVAKWNSTPSTIIDYDAKIKLYRYYRSGSGYGSYTEEDYSDNIVVIIESVDGKYYIAKTTSEIAIGGGEV